MRFVMMMGLINEEQWNKLKESGIIITDVRDKRDGLFFTMTEMKPKERPTKDIYLSMRDFLKEIIFKRFDIKDTVTTIYPKNKG
jgi:hypothetical protein